MTDEELIDILNTHALPECVAALVREQIAEAYERGRRDQAADRVCQGKDLRLVAQAMLDYAKTQRPGAEVVGVKIEPKRGGQT
jgi:hypothetical protein